MGQRHLNGVMYAKVDGEIFFKVKIYEWRVVTAWEFSDCLNGFFFFAKMAKILILFTKFTIINNSRDTKTFPIEY